MKTRPKVKCRNCGLVWPHPAESPCPAKGKRCKKCGKLNHFARVCLSAQGDRQEKEKSYCFRTNVVNTIRRKCLFDSCSLNFASFQCSSLVRSVSRVIASSLRAQRRRRFDRQFCIMADFSSLSRSPNSQLAASFLRRVANWSTVFWVVCLN